MKGVAECIDCATFAATAAVHAASNRTGGKAAKITLPPAAGGTPGNTPERRRGRNKPFKSRKNNQKSNLRKIMTDQRAPPRRPDRAAYAAMDRPESSGAGLAVWAVEFLKATTMGLVARALEWSDDPVETTVASPLTPGAPAGTGRPDLTKKAGNCGKDSGGTKDGAGGSKANKQTKKKGRCAASSIVVAPWNWIISAAPTAPGQAASFPRRRSTGKNRQSLAAWPVWVAPGRGDRHTARAKPK